MEYILSDKYKLVKEALLKETSDNPITIVKNIMHKDFINIHGPEHHYLDGGAMLVAMYNNGYKMDLENNLDKLAERTIKMPGAMCGFWGMCGSVASIGAVFSLLDNTGPLSNDINYSKHMKYTSSVINKMSEIGGPRCCKRNAFISLMEGVKYSNMNYGTNIKIDKVKCEFTSFNKDCIKDRCPFHK